MKEEIFALKGICIYSKDKQELNIMEGYILSVNGICKGVYEQLPLEFEGIPVEDYTRKLIIPGLIDLHLHAPQYPYIATGMDMELLEWLNTHTFPEEAKYEDLNYAKKAYSIFVKDIVKSPTTRACIFGTIHLPSTLLLMNMLEDTGLKTMVGKVNMDRNCPEYIKEESAEKAIEDTISFIKETKAKYKNTSPILTPRFIPTCSNELMTSLGELKEAYNLALQSHLSENTAEITWVAELCPEAENYAEAYERAGSFHPSGKTIMAHCVHLTAMEEELLKRSQVFIAHCPESNLNLASGIAPVKNFLKNGLQVGLGTDIGAGSSLNLFRAMTHAIQSSKMYWRYIDNSCLPLTVEEVFYLGTKGGGAFFGNVGSFEEGYEMDAVVLNDNQNDCSKSLTPKERLERMVYLGGSENIISKYVSGKKVYSYEVEG